MKNINVMLISMEENDKILKTSNAARVTASKIKEDIENGVQRDFYKDICAICNALDDLNKVLNNVDEI